MPTTYRLVILIYFFIPKVNSVFCKCTGSHCISDACQGEFCVAAFLTHAGSALRSGFVNLDSDHHPTHIYLRGCVSTVNIDDDLHRELIADNCFDYDEVHFENEQRKICFCSSDFCNDGPLINTSSNRFRQKSCPSSNNIDNKMNCVGEYCFHFNIDQKMEIDNHPIKCINRTLPILDAFLSGLSIMPAFSPTVIRYPPPIIEQEPYFSTVGLLCQNTNIHDSNQNCTLFDQKNISSSTLLKKNHLKCPIALIRIEHRDDPNFCQPPKYSYCDDGEFCIDIRFNVSTYRDYILERRFSGCVVAVQNQQIRNRLNRLIGKCASLESAVTSIAICIESPTIENCAGKGRIVLLLRHLFLFLVYFYS